jgi:hypothetical protein
LLRHIKDNASGQLDILEYNKDALGVDDAEIGVLNEAAEVGLVRLLKVHHREALKVHIDLDILDDLAEILTSISIIFIIIIKI